MSAFGILCANRIQYMANVNSSYSSCLMQMHALRRELSEGLRPLHETFIALIRLFGSKGHATRGLEMLAAMEKLNYDIRKAWLVLVGNFT